jgi:hypothetical protein
MSRISVEALMQRFGVSSYAEVAALEAFGKHRADIQDLARRKIAAGQYDEQRGEVLINSKRNWRR